MSRLWHLLKKDFAILRWPLVAWLFLLGLKMWTRWQAERGGDDTGATLSWLVTISQSAMTVVLAFGLTKLDSPASLHGQHRLWPVSPREWLAAKTCAALFWLVALPALLWWLLLLALSYGSNALILAEEDAAWRLLLVLGALAVPASSGRSPVMKAAWIIVAAGGVLIGGTLGAEIRGAASMDPFAGDRRFLAAALPFMICCAAGFAGSFFDKTRRFAAMGLLLGIGLSVAALMWSARLPWLLAPKFPPAPAGFAGKGEIVVTASDVSWKPITDSGKDLTPWLELKWRGDQPGWLRLVPGSVSIQDAQGKIVPLEEWPVEVAKPASSLAKAAADAVGPANRDVFLNSCTPLDSRVGRHRLGRINAESARALFSQPGKLRAVFERVSLMAPRLTELPGQGEKPKTQNGFRQGFAPLPHLGEYSLQADSPAKNLMITEHTPVRSFHWPPLNAQGLRRPVFRFPGLIAWVPEGKFAMPLPPVDGRYPGTTAAEPTSYWMASSGIIQATVRAADEIHPLTKLSPYDPAFWKHVRFMALEWELVSLGTREVTVPLFMASENPLQPTIRRKRQP